MNCSKDSYLCQIVTNIGEIRAKAVAEKQVEVGLVDASGNNKARFYILSSKVYKERDNIVHLYLRRCLRHE